MNRHKIVSYLFLVLGILVIVGSAYVIISYASDIINAIVTFVTTNDYSKLQGCGVTPPSQFNKLKAEFATVILPSLYIGLPLLLIVLSALMFLSGFYYYKGRLEDESKKHEQLEREMVHKIVRKMETEKPPPSRPQPGRPQMGPRPAEPEEPEEPPPESEEPHEDALEEPAEEEEPPPRPVMKRRK